MQLIRDRLFLLRPGFTDPAYPSKQFYCWHCALMEGVLASFPDLAARIDVERIAWPRPRAAVVALLGAQNQSLPVLVLAERQTSAYQTGTHAGHAFIDDRDRILTALTERHGFPWPHT